MMTPSETSKTLHLFAPENLSSLKRLSPWKSHSFSPQWQCGVTHGRSSSCSFCSEKSVRATLQKFAATATTTTTHNSHLHAKLIWIESQRTVATVEPIIMLKWRQNIVSVKLTPLFWPVNIKERNTEDINKIKCCSGTSDGKNKPGASSPDHNSLCRGHASVHCLWAVTL